MPKTTVPHPSKKGAGFLLQQDPKSYRRKQKSQITDEEIIEPCLREDNDEMQYHSPCTDATDDARREEQCRGEDELENARDHEPLRFVDAKKSVDPWRHPPDPRKRMHELVDAKHAKDDDHGTDEDPARNGDILHTTEVYRSIDLSAFPLFP